MKENKFSEKIKKDIIKVNYAQGKGLPKIEKLGSKELEKKLDNVKKIFDYNKRILEEFNLEYKGSALSIKEG